MKTKTNVRPKFITAPGAFGALLVLLCCFAPPLLCAETAVQEWEQRSYGWGDFDQTAAVVVDTSNNVIVVGASYHTATANDYLTIKYSSQGMPLWTNRYNHWVNRMDVPNAVAVDGSNCVIVTGYSEGFPSSPDYYNGDYATIKYSSAGEVLWINRYGGSGDGSNMFSGWDGAAAVAVDHNNDVIVTGKSSNGTNGDYATIKYSSNGAELWVRRYNGPPNSEDSASAVAVDAGNNVIVTGSSVGSASTYDYLTIKYSSSGDPLWTNRYNGPANSADHANTLTVDASDNVIVTGESAGSDTGSDYATIIYSSAGIPLWTNRYNGPGNGFDEARGLAVDGSNNIIVLGDSVGNGTGYDYATIKYSSSGVPLWTNRYCGPGNSEDRVAAIAVDRHNNLVVTGTSPGNSGDHDYVTIKYSASGVPLWICRYNGTGNTEDRTVGIAVDHSNNVIVTGTSSGTSPDRFVTVKYACGTWPELTAMPLTNGMFQLRVDEVLPSGSLVIEATSNLTDWSPVFTNILSTNVVFHTDPDSSNHLRRFYRALQLP